MDSNVAHPVSPGLIHREMAPRFSPYRRETGGDPLWHFQLMVNSSSQLAAASNEVPKPGGGLISLALLTRSDPPCDLEIFGQALQVELDPADWLDWWMGEAKIKQLSVKRIRGIGGAIGDVIGTWMTPKAELIGRFFCFKAGARLIFICFRSSVADYPKLADEFLLSMTTFSLLKTSQDNSAEELRWIEFQSPLVCRVPVPVSWEVRMETPPGDAEEGDGAESGAESSSADSVPQRGTAFHANLSAASPSGPMLMAQVSFALLDAAEIADHTEAFKQAIEAVSDAGLTVPDGPIETESPRAPFTGSWFTVRQAETKGQKSEFRCRILRHPKAWVIAVAICVERQTSVPVWMRSKRLLDIVTSVIDFGNVK